MDSVTAATIKGVALVGVESVALENGTLEEPGTVLTSIVFEGVASATLVNGILLTGCIFVGGNLAELNDVVLKDVLGTVSQSVVAAGSDSAEVEDICCNRFLLDAWQPC